MATKIKLLIVDDDIKFAKALLNIMEQKGVDARF
jgi:ActR/RegA family two-component response regulator